MTVLRLLLAITGSTLVRRYSASSAEQLLLQQQQQQPQQPQQSEWSGPDVKVADVSGSAVWTFDGKIQTPQYFKITLTQGYRPPPTGNRTQLDYELRLAAAAGLCQ